jgi:hypothetical protein
MYSIDRIYLFHDRISLEVNLNWVVKIGAPKCSEFVDWL